jgi:hypothetical protein
VTEHLTHDQLLQYIDGELKRSAARRVKEHLQACWSCRTALERLKEDIGTIFDAQNHLLLRGFPAPPHPWPRLEGRLASSDLAHHVSRRRGAPALRFLCRPSYGAVAASVLLIAALIWLAPSSLSAKEVLLKISQADMRRFTNTPGNFIRQRVVIKRTDHHTSGVHQGNVEVWHGSTGNYWKFSERDEVASALQELFRNEHMPNEIPLSAASYRVWSDQAPSKARVLRGFDGGTILLSASVQGLDSMDRVSLRVRSADWWVTSLELHLTSADFEVSEKDFSVVSRANVPLDVLARLEPHTAVIAHKGLRSTPLTTVAPRTTPVAVNVEDVEMQVREALHAIKADLGEPIDIVNEVPDRTTVILRLDSGARLEEVRQALANIAHVEVRSVFGDVPPLLVAPSGGPVRDPSAKKLSVPNNQEDERLTHWFGSSDAKETFTRSALNSSTALLSHLYALKELADRWPSPTETKLSSYARQTLENIVRDHARSALDECTHLKTALEPMFEVFATGESNAAVHAISPDWRVSAATGLASGRAGDDSLRSVLTTSDTPASLDRALPVVRRRLQETEEALHSLGR